MLAAYLMFTAVLVLTPGSTTAVVVRNALSGGRAGGIAAAAGAAVANTSHATAAALGLAVVFARWPLAFPALRIGGAAYLAWLGARSVYRAARYADGGLVLPCDLVAPPSRSAARGGFRQGLAVNLLNPAIAMFYLVVVPSFVPAQSPRWYFALLALVHVAMAFAIHLAWTLSLDHARHLVARFGLRRGLEAATGIALIGLGLRVLLTGPLHP